MFILMLIFQSRTSFVPQYNYVINGPFFISKQQIEELEDPHNPLLNITKNIHKKAIIFLVARLDLNPKTRESKLLANHSANE